MLPYINNHASVPDNYRGKEIYKCMNENCGYQWRGNAGPQGTCFKCAGIFMKWENFESDWIYTNDGWKRKEFINEHQREDTKQPDNSDGISQG